MNIIIEQKKYILAEKCKLTHDVYKFIFTPVEENFDFLPGQFVNIHIPPSFLADNKNFLADRKITLEKTLMRAYSIASTPEEKTITLIVKMLPDGIGGKFLQEMKLDAAVDISGPFGHFVTSQTQTSKIYIATGVGVAPIVPMIKSIRETNMPLQIIFGMRHEEDLFYTDILHNLKKQYSALQITLCASQPQDTFKGYKGRVTQYLEDYMHYHDVSDHEFYICGSGAMVQDVRTLLQKKEILKEHIFFEKFSV